MIALRKILWLQLLKWPGWRLAGTVCKQHMRCPLRPQCFAQYAQCDLSVEGGEKGLHWHQKLLGSGSRNGEFWSHPFGQSLWAIAKSLPAINRPRPWHAVRTRQSGEMSSDYWLGGVASEAGKAVHLVVPPCDEIFHWASSEASDNSTVPDVWSLSNQFVVEFGPQSLWNLDWCAAFSATLLERSSVTRTNKWSDKKHIGGNGMSRWRKKWLEKGLWHRLSVVFAGAALEVQQAQAQGRSAISLPKNPSPSQRINWLRHSPWSQPILRKRLTCSNLQQMGNIFFPQPQRSPSVKSEKVLRCHPLLGFHHHCSFGQSTTGDWFNRQRQRCGLLSILHKILLLHRRSAGTPKPFSTRRWIKPWLHAISGCLTNSQDSRFSTPTKDFRGVPTSHEGFSYKKIAGNVEPFTTLTLALKKWCSANCIRNAPENILSKRARPVFTAPHFGRLRDAGSWSLGWGSLWDYPPVN